jgi:nucleoid DNA-binding protein
MTARKLSGFPNGPIRNLDQLAHFVSQQYPEFRRPQVLALINFTFHTIGQSLEQQAARGDKKPRVELCRFGAFEFRWYKASRFQTLDGRVQDIPARWRPRFVFTPAWRQRFRGTSAVTRTLGEDSPALPSSGDARGGTTGDTSGLEAPGDPRSPAPIPPLGGQMSS